MKFIDLLRKRRMAETVLLKENTKDVDFANTRMLRWLLSLGIFSFTLLFVMSFFVGSYQEMRVPYGIILSFLLVNVILRRFVRTVTAVSLLYSSYTILVGICIYTSTFVTSDTTSALILIFLLQVPIVIIDHSWKVNTIEVVFAIVYIIFVVIGKQSNLILDECVNVSIASFVAIILGEHLRKTQIENFDLKRQASIREHTDALTSLSNRRKLFLDLKAATPSNAIQGMIMIDIDNFKAYNDTYGHVSGDQCLRNVSEVLKAVSNRYPVCFYRYGGEEFLGIVYHEHKEVVASICEEIVQRLYALQLPHSASSHRFVSASIGACYKEEASQQDYEKMISEADQALYQAKADGKNRVVLVP